jgi:hypothetical protein
MLRFDMGKPEGAGDRRRMADRRSRSRPRLKFFLLGGRRKSARRGGDRKEFIYVDQYRPWLLVAIMLLAILSISDGLFTLHLIERGATETNPVLAWFLNLGAGPFMTVKFLLACLGILIFLVFHNFYFRPLRIKVKTFLPAFIAVFLVVIFWQLFLNLLIK